MENSKLVPDEVSEIVGGKWLLVVGAFVTVAGVMPELNHDLSPWTNCVATFLGALSVPVLLIVLHRFNRLGKGNWLEILVGRPWFGALSETVILAISLGIAYWNRDVVARIWADRWADVERVATIASILFILLSYFNPGLYWRPEEESWLEHLTEDRRATEKWTDDNSKFERVDLSKHQRDLLKKHKECAVFWIAFFVLIPPIWFLMEYSFVSEFLGMTNESKEMFEQFKGSQERAKPLWIAWVAVLATWHGIIGSPAKNPFSGGD
jgi:hypothetical protein